MHITKSKKILDLIEMKSRILVIIVGMYCYWYSVTIWNGDSRYASLAFHRIVLAEMKCLGEVALAPIISQAADLYVHLFLSSV